VQNPRAKQEPHCAQKYQSETLHVHSPFFIIAILRADCLIGISRFTLIRVFIFCSVSQGNGAGI
jgi:hypothetical protein